MVGSKDILDLLDRIPIWKRLTGLPKEVDALSERVAALENQLEPAPGRRCEKCGNLSLRQVSARLVGSHPHKYVRQIWQCEKCDHRVEAKG